MLGLAERPIRTGKDRSPWPLLPGAKQKRLGKAHVPFHGSGRDVLLEFPDTYAMGPNGGIINKQRTPKSERRRQKRAAILDARAEGKRSLHLAKTMGLTKRKGAA